jgi:hypothetical protein
MEWIELCVQRASTRPLVLDYSIDNQSRENELSDMLPKSMAARLRLSTEECYYLTREFLFLRCIVLSSDSLSGALLLSEFAPSTQLCLQDIAIYDSAFLLSPVPLPSLRSLNLIRVDMFDPLVEVPQILNHSSLLEILILKEGPMKHSIAHAAQARPKLVLPRLRVLRLSGRLTVIGGLMQILPDPRDEFSIHIDGTPAQQALDVWRLLCSTDSVHDMIYQRLLGWWQQRVYLPLPCGAVFACRSMMLGRAKKETLTFGVSSWNNDARGPPNQPDYNYNHDTSNALPTKLVFFKTPINITATYPVLECVTTLHITVLDPMHVLGSVRYQRHREHKGVDGHTLYT